MGLSKPLDIKVILTINPDGTAQLHKIVKPKGVDDVFVREIKRLVKNFGKKWIPGGTVDAQGHFVAQKSYTEITVTFDPAYRLSPYTTVVHVAKPGTLSTLLTPMQQDTCTSLCLSGRLNSADIRTLRKMAGYEASKGQLKFLDMQHVRLEKDEEPYLEISNAGKMLQVMDTISKYRTDNLTSFEERTDFQSEAYRGNKYQNRLRSAEQTEYFLALMSAKEPVNTELLKKRKLMDFKGHRIEENEDKVKYIATMYKNTFCYDFFYGCTQLRIVILPLACKLNRKVVIGNDTIIYAGVPIASS